MQIVLVVAAVVSLIIGEYRTFVGLTLLTVFNAWLGYHQEGKAEAAAALGKMMKAVAKVRRDGEVTEVPAAPPLSSPPADGRVIVAATLQIEEGALTGESVAVEKNVDAIAGTEVPLGDRHDMAFMNTNVTRGHGEILVTTTGMGSEVGHIADMLAEQKVEKTPLTRQVDRLTIFIIGMAMIAFVAILIMGYFAGPGLRGALRHRRRSGRRLDPGCAARRRDHDSLGRVGEDVEEERHREGAAGG